MSEWSQDLRSARSVEPGSLLPAKMTTMTIPPAVTQELSGLLGSSNVRSHEPVARYTTWRVGGPVSLLCVAHSSVELSRAIQVLRAAEIPWLVLGRGSNVLFDDAGLEGVIVVNRADRLDIGDATVYAESGVLLSVLARRTVAGGRVGLEWCHDIPGSVGGAIVNNAGANGGAIADVLRSAYVMPVRGQPHELSATELDLSYRHSVLRTENAEPSGARPVVLSATFQVWRGEIDEVTARMAEQRAKRKATQPGGASAGSVFKNPTGDSAGRLIESVGLKGTHRGDAAISTLHANFIVTGRRATAADVLGLIALMRFRVQDALGIDLKPEVQFVHRDGRIGPPPLVAS